MKRSRVLYACLLYLIIYFQADAQKNKFDTSFVQKHTRKNVVELYSGRHSSEFTFISPGRTQNNFRLVANNSVYLGAYCQYKWLSFNLSTAVPGTQLEKNIRLRYTSLSFRFGGTFIMLRPFFSSYNGLLLPERSRSAGFRAFKDIQITNAGTDLYYYLNGKRFSYSAAGFSSKLQLKNAGSFISMSTPMWKEIKWKNPSRELISDSSTYDLFISQPQWVSFTTRIGYTYNFIFKKGRWGIAPALLPGIGGLHELKSSRQGIQLITDVQAWINAGYNGSCWYFYTMARWNKQQTNLFVKNLQQVNADVSVTFGLRFRELNKKMLGIL